MAKVIVVDSAHKMIAKKLLCLLLKIYCTNVENNQIHDMNLSLYRHLWMSTISGHEKK